MNEEHQPEIPPTVSQQDVNMWAMFCHLSTLLAFPLPIAGLVAPILIWQIKKDEMPAIDAHGKMVLNFIISMAIYWAIAIALSFVFVGFVLLPVLVVIGVVFPIIGGIKANNGELWQYPLILNLVK